MYGMLKVLNKQQCSNVNLCIDFPFQKIEKKENSKSSKVKEKIDVPEETNKNEDIEGGTDGSHLETEESILPKWLTRYLQFRFDLLDRTGTSQKVSIYVYKKKNILWKDTCFQLV